MDFIDALRQYSSRVEKMRAQIQTEEATKTSLIMPFFQQVFGYDVFNPDEFVPEFTADVGIKKGEKVDYAIFMDGEPVILIEAKWCGAPLEKHDSQLFRYFGTSKAKFGILTNGVTYKFYTDLEEQNKMDMKPFLELNLLDIKETLVPELKRFCKSNFNVDEIFSSASELKYSNEIRSYFDSQLREPSDDFARFILAHTYDGVKTQAVLEKFKPIIKSTLNNYIGELMNDKITAALKSERQPPVDPGATEPQPSEVDEEIRNKIVTTQEELESLGIIKGLLCDLIDPTRISYRDTERYFSVICDNRTTKWLCRLYLEGKKKMLILPAAAEPPYEKESRYSLESVNDLYIFRDNLRASAKRFVEPKE